MTSEGIALLIAEGDPLMPPDWSVEKEIQMRERRTRGPAGAQIPSSRSSMLTRNQKRLKLAKAIAARREAERAMPPLESVKPESVEQNVQPSNSRPKPSKT